MFAKYKAWLIAFAIGVGFVLAALAKTFSEGAKSATNRIMKRDTDKANEILADDHTSRDLTVEERYRMTHDKE